MKFLCGFSLFLLVSIGAKAEVIDSKTFEGKWPFTVEHGDLQCIRYKEVIFISNGKTYGINGIALNRGAHPVEEIWKKDPEMMEYYEHLAKSEGKSIDDLQDEMGTPRVNISDVINKGLSLCGND